MSNPTAPKLALADAIRALAMDAVQQANSGHPGAPMGMAEIAQALWTGNLRHNPKDPAWANRDRFVLSNGHGSMLIYALLHLTGYDLPIEELKNFRQLHSKTPGHPEVGITPGVETTTGPLGQGLGNAVGMALAEALLAAEFNKPGTVTSRTTVATRTTTTATRMTTRTTTVATRTTAATRTTTRTTTVATRTTTAATRTITRTTTVATTTTPALAVLLTLVSALPPLLALVDSTAAPLPSSPSSLRTLSLPRASRRLSTPTSSPTASATS
jgi:hypothetical protein